MFKSRFGVCVAIVLATLATSSAQAQSLLYTFDSGWPTEIYSWSSTTSADSATDLYNDRNRSLYIGTSYPGFENSVLFGTPGNAALWGDQLNGSVAFEFFGQETTRYISFDFAWYINNDAARDFIYVDLLQYGSTLSTQQIFLPDWFETDFGGWEGKVVINTSDYGFDDGITGIRINVHEPFGHSSGAFAIDNLYASTNVPGLPDENNTSQLKITYNGGTVEYDWVGLTILQDTGDFSYLDEITNVGSDATTYTLSYDGGVHAPDYTSVVNVPIGGYETLPPGSLIAILPTDQASGSYTGTVTLHNDINPNDPDKTLTIEYQVYAPAIVTVNTGDVITPTDNNTISIANADIEGHDGALRASLQVVSQVLEGSGFYLADDGLKVNDLILPGDIATTTIGFNPYGKVAGEYEGTFAVSLAMVAGHWPSWEGHATGLNRAPAPETYMWQLRHVVAKTTYVEQTIDPGTNLGQAGIGLADEHTAMTLLDGYLAESHSVIAQFTTNPSPTTAKILGSAVELNLGEVSGYYVLQLTYRDEDVPAGINELDLRLNVYDPETGAWVHAILLNSDGGTGGTFFEGSYDAYLAFIGFTPALSAYGVDTELNHVWAVLDHNSIFGIAVPEPASLVLLCLGGALVLSRRR